MLKGFTEGLFRNAGLMLLLPVLILHVTFGNELQASEIFVTMGLLTYMAGITIFFLNLAMNSIAEYLALMKRLQ